ncbi:hypothetical protein [Enterococcus hirae]|uniref:hypothetical protein n=1 Tax=Enterococcus TaxID=1350 RepID=UPI001E285A5F|nr:hypothetical protein [Enterococcus hirae]
MWVSVITVTVVLSVSALSGTTAWAAEQNADELETSKNDLQISDESVTLYSEGDIVVQQNASGELLVTKMETKTRASVSRWGAWQYTNIAVSTGVAANAINAAFYAGAGASIAMFGIPGWAIGGLLTGASWTNLGSAPGVAVARKWDRNKNGWVGFHKRTGYDGAGRAVATQYKTE